MKFPFRNQIVSQQSLSAAKQKSQSQPRSLSYILMERWGQHFRGMFIFSRYVYVRTSILLLFWIWQHIVVGLYELGPVLDMEVSFPFSITALHQDHSLPLLPAALQLPLRLVHGSGRSIKIFFKWLLLKFREQVGQSMTLFLIYFAFDKIQQLSLWWL